MYQVDTVLIIITIYLPMLFFSKISIHRHKAIQNRYDTIYGRCRFIYLYYYVIFYFFYFIFIFYATFARAAVCHSYNKTLTVLTDSIYRYIYIILYSIHVLLSVLRYAVSARGGRWLNMCARPTRFADACGRVDQLVMV